MTSRRRPAPPLNAESLDRLALRYVERFATTRAKLGDYLRRKVRERGWDGATVDPDDIAGRMAELGYVDDRAFAAARARSMARRGLGARRVAQAFHAAGITAEDAEAVAPEIEEKAIEAALALARRKRIGPFAVAVPDREGREKQLAQMVRGGHDFALARRIVDMAPGEDTGTFSVE
ncbi:regulatory protein RecX [Hephaestia mangrovi]|uniref:regulatory protein RecX n=1 Tax=Hephaestia mangrovi TaxID=2873268 RepID=UPI001CA70275|nr:RecX family transcriptional regulator [Hephaestia mangrovi]MBY8827421.1 RecX family transcriptional regulator [Hephaestia mangrovi]